MPQQDSNHWPQLLLLLTFPAGTRAVQCEALLQLPVSHTHLGQGCTTAGVVDDLPYHTLDVVVALSRVEHAVLGCTLAVGVVGLEHRPPTLTLGPDNATHLQAGSTHGKEGEETIMQQQSGWGCPHCQGTGASLPCPLGWGCTQVTHASPAAGQAQQARERGRRLLRWPLGCVFCCAPWRGAAVAAPSQRERGRARVVRSLFAEQACQNPTCPKPRKALRCSPTS